MPRFLSVILKVLFALLLLVVLAVVGTLVALRIPSVQTDVAQRAARILTDKLGQQVIVNRVDIRPFSRVVLEGVRVLDRRGNELFNIGRADADIRLFSVFDPSHLHVGKLTLEEPRFNLVTYKNQPDSTTLDQFISSVKRLLGPSDTTKVSKPFDFKIEALGLRNGRFVLDRQNVPRIPEYGRTMDYAHMYLDSIYADADQLWFKGDTIHANIQGLRTVDTPSGTRLRELTSDMTYAGKFWEFDKLMLRVQNSQLHDYLRFEYQHFLNFTDFNDSVKVIARLKPSRVYSDDIAKFAPQPFMRELKETVLISGEAKGYVRNFTTKNLDVTYGRNTRVKGDINVEGLPNFKESFIEMRLQPSVVDGRDIRRYIPASGWPYVQRLGTVKLKGQFLGFYNDFVANGSFQTALGSVVSDVNLKFKDDPRYSSYEGTVRTAGFQLGRLLGDESVVRDVTMNGKVAGVGFDLRTARLTANATIPSIWLNGYRFRNIRTNGRFSRESFTGKLAANDPNLQFDADGTVELNKQRQAFDLRARIRRADLRALGLTNRSVVVATTADVKFKGLKLDELLGYARLRNSRLSYAGRTVPIDTLDIVSQYGGGQRRLTVRSEVLNLALDGNFTPTTVLRDVTTLVEEYRLNFASNDVAIADYYSRKRQRPLPDYQIGLNLYLKRPNPVLHLFMPQLTVSDSTVIDGSFRNGQTSIFQLGGRVAEVRYDSLQLRNNEFDLTTSKLPYQPEVLAQASVTSERQRLPGLGATEKFYVEGVWDQERINFSTSLAQTGTTNKAQINGALAFLDDAVKVTFRQSGVNVLGKEWAIAPDNSLVISGGGREFDFQNVTLSNGNQSISAQGFLSENPNKPLALTVKDFELATLSGLTGTQKFGGRVNALGTISGVYGPLVINSTLTVDSLQMGNVLIGNVQGRGDWDNDLKRLGVNLDVGRDQQRVLAVTGYIAPGAEKQQLSLTGVLDNAPIKLAEPFLNTIFRDMSGTGVGTLRLNGLLSAPQLTGNIDVTNGQLTFIYLGTTYTFSDRIRFLEDRIALQNIAVRDPQGNSGVVNGNIYQQGFQNMRLDLNASFRKLQVLNTTRKDNELYFGQAYATGTAVVRGPADNLFINVTARSEAGTRVSLPFDNAAKAEQASYIRFVNRNLSDTARTAPVQVAGTTDLSGIRLNMNLDITPDAYVELLLDESTGDIIRGSATGQLRLNIDTRGDFNMYGQVEIVRGAYNFTLQGLVNKEFVVRPGGTISWNGDPLAGEMNVTATYTQRTSLAPIVYNTGNSSSSNAAVVPVTAVMNLSGPLLQPIIRLNLEFNDIPSSLEGDLAPFFSAIRNDEQELNRQVFSLIVFRQLTPIGSLAVTRLQGENNAIGNSLGQIISTQLGLLTSQIDPNLEISFNLNGLTAEDLQALQLRLSYAFLNGRLRITREGSISSNTTATTGGTTPIASSQTSFIGDLSLEYYLRPDGKFRAKLRYETTPRDLTSFTQGVNQARAGVSLLHTEQFDTFRELFSRKRLRRRDQNARKARELQIDDDPRTVM
ncbi:translocation/assembly module TamB domain-containing protein [Hymenobacter endophyticus]|uniref:Translocation/assembly module TamB domain-containing protein n=1 Tax=Hymenobacter endophyticus TaxID=3076335 RepID=A0ABU3TIF3_9BACT|nr:translocation/assembly module TamB domain-containing protein [Hymenobacter endophyticus]MDU0371155.1 translocation/assembly module TamB domain-containing protein [Hymenobacter endophyticus]